MTQPLLPADLIEAAQQVIDANRAAGRRIAVAESCTGGLVTAALTEVPGSSDVLDCGFVTYSNEAKVAMLGVAQDVLDTFGSVSEATAWAMARGAIDRSAADVAVAITGIAGPGGGTPKKPVGTVVFARALKGDAEEDITAGQQLFDGTDRSAIRLQAALAALALLVPGAEFP